MAPEYAVDGLFSLKSDIFSFGVLVLEIVSGRKNRGFHSHDHLHNLVGHVSCGSSFKTFLDSEAILSFNQYDYF